MRIGFIVVKSLLCGGGVETYTYEVGRRMVALGHEVIVFSMGQSGDISGSVQGMRVIKVPCLSGASTERITASISGVASAILHKPRLDILHFHTPMSGVFGIIPTLLGFVTVVQMHGIDWQRSRWGGIARSAIRGMERAVMRLMPNCTAVSETQIGFYEKMYGRRLSMIPTGAQAPQISGRTDEIHKLGLLPRNYVLFMSRLVPEKGAHLLISAFRNLRTEYKLVLGGGTEPSDPYTRSLLSLAGGDKRIIFPGYVAGEMKNQLFSNAALYVQPSELEGLSIALLEAMSYRIPCLASDIPENIEAIGNAGVTFANGNAADLRSHLIEMLAHEEECGKLAAIAMDRVLQEFSWDKVTGKLLDLYRHCLIEHNANRTNMAFTYRLTKMIAGKQRPSRPSDRSKVIVLTDSADRGSRCAATRQSIRNEVSKIGIRTDFIAIRGSRIHSCVQCGQCSEMRNCQCAQTDDIANTIIARIADADGIVVAIAADDAQMSPELTALLERAAIVAEANGGMFRHKVGAALVSGTRMNVRCVTTQLGNFFQSSGIEVADFSPLDPSVDCDTSAQNEDDVLLRISRLCRSLGRCPDHAMATE